MNSPSRLLNNQPWKHRDWVTVKKRCDLCHGSGYTLELCEKGYAWATECACRKSATMAQMEAWAEIPERYKAVTVKAYKPQDETQKVGRDAIVLWLKQIGADIKDAPWLYIQGPVGTGKTHLACAIMKALAGKKVWSLYRSCPSLIDEFRQEYQDGGDSQQYWDALCAVPVLCIDDLGAEASKNEFPRERICALVDQRYNASQPMVVTSNLDFRQLADAYSPRMSSRLHDMSTVIHIDGPDYRKSRQLKLEGVA